MIEAYRALVEVHVPTSLEECERRRSEGPLWIGGRGQVKKFTGTSTLTSATPQARLDTENFDVDYCAQQVILKLENMGLIRA